MKTLYRLETLYRMETQYKMERLYGVETLHRMETLYRVVDTAEWRHYTDWSQCRPTVTVVVQHVDQ